MAIVLLITSEDGQTTELPIFGKCTVGRSSSCDFNTSDKQMSGKHGVFELNSAGELIYSDLGSTNGSFLNNNQIQKIQFRTNEVLRIGNTTITIDEKRLNTKERITIGKGTAVDEDRTIVLPAGTKSILREPKVSEAAPQANEVKETPKPRKGVVLNQALKKKTATPPDWTSVKDELIEQEESSGKTKFLKLSRGKKPSK